MKNKFLNAFVIALILFQAVAPIGALAYVGTNQSDYAPGSVVTLSGDGTGFLGGETVHVDVTGPDGYTAACETDANENGAWFCQFTLSADAPDGYYSYLATVQSSDASQSGSFTVTAPPPPTVEPTAEPTAQPTVEPTTQPTVVPTTQPTVEPTTQPTTEPTLEPTIEPTAEPTASPTEEPRVEPTDTAPAPTPTGPVLTPFIHSDKDDYYMGELVTLTSGNWQPGESVHLIVNDVLGDSWRLADDVPADNNGAFVYQFNLPDWFVAQYHVYAYGELSGATTWDFTDARNFVLTFAGTGTGSVVLTPNTGTINAPVSCGGTGTALASQTVTSTCAPNITTSANTVTVTFNATATGGSTFGGWSAPANLTSSTCTGTTNPCSAGFNANPALTVTFNANTNTAPVASAVSISGTAQYGQLLTGNYTYSDADGDAQGTSTFRWLRNGSTVVGTSLTYTTVSADVEQTLTFEVTPVAATGTSPGTAVQSSAVTIAKAPLTVTASSHTVTYGDDVPSVTPSYSGFVNGETAAVLDTAPTCSTTYTDGSPASPPTYPTNCSGGVDGNYSFSYVAGAVSVDKATLTVTASSHTVTYGDDVPTITPSYSGFVNGQDETALGTQPTCSTTYTDGSPASPPTYPTNCSGGVDGNYSFSYVAGAVSVDKALLTITANDKTVSEGASWPVFDVSYDGFVNGEGPGVLGDTLVCTSDAPNPTTDNGPFLINCSGLTSDNYSITFQPGTLTVTNVAPTVGTLVLTGASGTACMVGNVVKLDFSFSDPGINDANWHVVINWGDGSQTTYDTTTQGAQPQQSHTYAAGTYTITVTVTDKDFDVGSNSSSTGAVSFLWNLSNILQPVNPGPPNSIFKYGSTIPVKVKVTDCNNMAVGTLTLKVTWQLLSSGTPTGDVSEPFSTSAADTGNTMRFTGAPDSQYIFNLASKSFPDGTAKYRLYVTIVSTGQQVYADIGLKTK